MVYLKRRFNKLAVGMNDDDENFTGRNAGAAQSTKRAEQKTKRTKRSNGTCQQRTRILSSRQTGTHFTFSIALDPHLAFIYQLGSERVS